MILHRHIFVMGLRIHQVASDSLFVIYMSFAYIEYPICVTVTAYSGTFVAVNIQQPLIREEYQSNVMRKLANNINI